MIESTHVVSHYGDEPPTVSILVEAKAMQAEAGARLVRAVLAHIRDGIAQALPGGAPVRSAHPRP